MNFYPILIIFKKIYLAHRRTLKGTTTPFRVELGVIAAKKYTGFRLLIVYAFRGK